MKDSPGLLPLLGCLLLLVSTTIVCAADSPATAVPATVELLSGVAYGTGGGHPLLLDLARPKVAGPEPRPAVVFIHGGGWAGSDRSNGLPIILLLAEQGFVAASIDYRLSGEAPFPAQLEDSKCAVRFLRSHAAEYGLDPQRIGVTGGSAGGHLSALVGLTPESAGLEGQGGWEKTSSAVSAVGDLYGISDLPSLIAEKKLSSSLKQLMRGTPEQLPELYRQANPLGWVQKGAPPFYLAHGDKDATVPLNQSEKMAAALKAVGTEATLTVMKGMGHGSIATLPQSVRQELADFFRKHLGPVPPVPGK